MKLTLILCLALLAFDRSSSARVVRMWNDAELLAASDLVVIGRPVETKDLNETNALGFASTQSFQSRFRGVETTFKVSAELKGTQVGDQFVLHHYRFEWGSPPNGPSLVEFNRGDTNEYLLYLKNDGTNRYASVTGQMDPTIKLWSAHRDGNTKFPPITNANPAIRRPVSICVPTRLKIERTSDTLSEMIDTNSLQSTNIMVGTNMITGVESKIYIYPEGESRPANGSQEVCNSLDFIPSIYYWHTKTDGIPLLGKKYAVEVDLTAFETDIPPQHMWSPHSKNYKVLWQRTLTQTVE